ncbi:MAG: DNA repair protein, partial [Salinivirgaceae bacterium]|nr:DNA repair protein [Salinivirgaceae bacterium]
KLASSIVLVHNHPSGSNTPSNEDKQLTAKIKEAAKFFDINLMDHIIVADKHYYSFCNAGLI